MNVEEVTPASLINQKLSEDKLKCLSEEFETNEPREEKRMTPRIFLN